MNSDSRAWKVWLIYGVAAGLLLCLSAFASVIQHADGALHAIKRDICKLPDAKLGTVKLRSAGRSPLQ